MGFKNIFRHTNSYVDVLIGLSSDITLCLSSTLIASLYIFSVRIEAHSFLCPIRTDTRGSRWDKLEQDGLDRTQAFRFWALLTQRP